MSSLRILYISGSIGLGHANRDLAIARELRNQNPSAEIMWLAGEPARQVIREAGENVLPESAGIAGTGLAEQSAGQFSLDLIKYVMRAQDAWKRTVCVFAKVTASPSGGDDRHHLSSASIHAVEAGRSGRSGRADGYQERRQPGRRRSR